MTEEHEENPLKLARKLAAQQLGISEKDLEKKESVVEIIDQAEFALLLLNKDSPTEHWSKTLNHPNQDPSWIRYIFESPSLKQHSIEASTRKAVLLKPNGETRISPTGLKYRASKVIRYSTNLFHDHLVSAVTLKDRKSVIKI